MINCDWYFARAGTRQWQLLVCSELTAVTQGQGTQDLAGKRNVLLIAVLF
jgi:hypothetical protein